jgi:WD40 repeat protein
MTLDEALLLVEQVCDNQCLNQAQEIVFRYAWEGKSYAEMAQDTGYDAGYLKDIGSKLWQSLSGALGQKVTKNNFKGVLRRYSQMQQRVADQPSVDRSEAPASSSTPMAASAVSLAPQPWVQPLPSDWDDIIDTTLFYGRVAELNYLERWVQQEKSRMVFVLGIGGIGKTSLVAKFITQKRSHFTCMIWRSLRNAPNFADLMLDCILQMSDQQAMEFPGSTDQQINLLMSYLRQRRCLLVFDNVESVLQSGQHGGTYRPGYEGYGQLFRRIADEPHQSSVILTSRERPIGLSSREANERGIRLLYLRGLPFEVSQQILEGTISRGNADDLKTLITRYRGNPLALKIVTSTIQALFAGDIAAFLAQGTVAYGTIWNLLEQQFNRLSSLEQQVMYWLAINREWTTLTQLQDDLAPPVPNRLLLEALESLAARSLIETPANQGMTHLPASFSQQPVVMEYVTERLIAGVCDEITDSVGDTSTCTVLSRCALLKAQTKDYLRAAQTSFILSPLVDRLIIAMGHRSTLIAHLTQGLEALRDQPATQVGYAGGNLLNLLVHLQADLHQQDLSNLVLWQAYLPQVSLHHASLTGADLRKAVFAQAFGDIVSVAFSPDSELLATADTLGNVQIWQVNTGRQLQAFKAHSFWLWCLTFSPDGKTLATAADDYLVKLWDVDTGTCLKQCVGHTLTVPTVAFSPDGKTLASGSQDSTIKLWDISDSSPSTATPTEAQPCLATLTGHVNRVWSVAFCAQTNRLVSTGEDQTIKFWNLATGECDRTITAHSAWIKSIACSPCGQWVASGSFDKTIQLWDGQTGERVRTFTGHSQTVTMLAFSADGNTLVSSSYDTTVKLWDMATGRCVRTLVGHTNRIWSVACSPNGQRIASGADDHAIKLWDAQTGQCVKTLVGYSNAPLSLALSADQNWLASGHEDQTIRLWEPTTGTLEHTLRGHTNRIWSVAFQPKPRPDRVLLASGSADGTAKLWDVPSGNCLQTCKGHTSWIWDVAFHPDGQQLATSSYDQTLKLWDVATGECTLTCQGHRGPVGCVTFSPDGTTLASGSFDTLIKLWDATTGECLQTLQGHSNNVWSLLFSADGQRLISCSYDQTIKLWDIATGQCTATLTGHKGPVLTVAFGPLRNQLISTSYDRTIKVWDLAQHTCIATLQGHNNIVCAMVPTPDQATHIFTSSFDETIKYWDLTAGTCLNTFRVPRPYEAMNITNISGITDAQKAILKALGAVEGSP